MLSAPVQVLRTQIQCSQLVQVLGARLGELIQQLPQRLALDFPEVSPAIEGRKRFCLAKLEYRVHARQPIGALGVNQVAHNLESIPRVSTFTTQSPRFRQITKKSVE